MIGQGNIQKIISMAIEEDTFPSFLILTGVKGSGKKTLIKEYIYPKLAESGFGRYWLPDTKIESIREMIRMANKISNTVFILPDADGMSVPAKNAMLKVVEELPNNNIFIMTLEDINNTLPTIKSRASVYTMDSYTREELKEYCIGKFLIDSGELDLCLDIAKVPRDIDLLVMMQITTFYKYVQLVIDNISKVSGSNSFKIADKVAIKEDEEGYDLCLFWKAFIRECNDRAVLNFEKDEIPKGLSYLFWSRETSRVLVRSRIKGINRQMLFDTWILNVREVSNEFANNSQ